MIILTASGTGGHIYPAIAVAQFLGQQKFNFLIESGRVSQTILDRHQYPYTALAIQRKKWGSFIKGLYQSYRFFKTHPVTHVYSFGGYVTIPVVLAAWACGLQITLFEQNTIPGRANRFLARFVSKVCLTFDESAKFFKRDTIIGGNPIRSSYLPDPIVDRLLKQAWLYKRCCLVFGGSQGANPLNSIIEHHYEWFESQEVCLIHIMGEKAYKKRYLDQPMVISETNDGFVKRIVVPYIHDMQRLYHWADYVIARSGATTVAELIAYQKLALLVPYPHAVDNHQYYNADAFVKLGLGLMVEQQLLTKSVIKDLFSFDQKVETLDLSLFDGWKTLLHSAT
tara:strand:- start:3980 stop:4996 length:1017 start_codon:yes stop_codon:yes gene_type:complete